LFLGLCVVVAGLSVCTLAVLLVTILIQGWPHLSVTFLRAAPAPNPEQAGVFPAVMGTLWVCGIAALVGLPLGVATAILLEEYRPKSRFARRVQSFVELNIQNLAGVPSVVYGILGISLFVHMFGWFGSPQAPFWEIGVAYYDQYLTEGDQLVWVPVPRKDSPPTPLKDGMRAVTPRGQTVTLRVVGVDEPLSGEAQQLAYTLRADAEGGRISRQRWYYVRLPFGRSVLAGALTLMLVTLPVVIIATQEALRSVPKSLREAALALGATRWQVVWNVTLPVALPGVMTGSILAVSRAMGEAAPVLIIAGIVYISHAPGNLMDDFSVLPLQIYNWAQRPQAAFHELAAAGIIVLLTILLCVNALAIWVRYRAQRSRL
jgi:phosphate transport system permease protein